MVRYIIFIFTLIFLCFYYDSLKTYFDLKFFNIIYIIEDDHGKHM